MNDRFARFLRLLCCKRIGPLSALASGCRVSEARDDTPAADDRKVREAAICESLRMLLFLVDNRVVSS